MGLQEESVVANYGNRKGAMQRWSIHRASTPKHLSTYLPRPTPQYVCGAGWWEGSGKALHNIALDGPQFLYIKKVWLYVMITPARCYRNLDQTEGRLIE